MLKMRLQRIGRKNDPSFRVVVTDSRRGPKSGKNVDHLGSYNPKLDRIQIDGERAKEWIGKGVQVSDTVHNLLVSEKVIEGKKINVLSRKSPIIDEEAIKKQQEEEEAKKAAEEAKTEEPETAEGAAEEEAPETAEAPDKATAEPEAAEAGATEDAPKEEEKA